MIAEPLVIEFDVAAAPAHAFEVWTERTASWWPPAHTISGDPAAITFEPRTGGRIYERARGGEEHLWGEVLEWQPPARLRYLWHLFFARSEATEVEVTFTAAADGNSTAVRLEQRGWGALGDAGAPRRTRTGQVWATLTREYARAARLT